MNNIGLLIKMSRIQQNMKQVTLARGICSTSYLSKIENNQTLPSEDVIHLLLNRLNIKVDEISKADEEELLEKVYELYKFAITDKNKDIITNKLKRLPKQNILFVDTNNYYLYSLYMQRINLIVDSSFEHNEKIFLGLDNLQENMNSRQMFLFNLNKGILYYRNSNFKKSLIMLEKALDKLSSSQTEEWEIADFYNILSTTYLMNNQLLNTIEYSNKSLEIYKDLFIFSRAVNCYILIGIAHKRNMNYKQAEENFLLAKKIVNELNISEQDSVINSNLGSLMSVMGHSDLAIQYYYKSLESKTTLDIKLTTIFSIVQEYYKLNNFAEVTFWCENGLELINDVSDCSFISYSFHFKLYLALTSDLQNTEDILIETISFFENIEDFRHVQKYSILLAEYYSTHRKYKNSSLYFQKANLFLYKLKSINSWEDL